MVWPHNQMAEHYIDAIVHRLASGGDWDCETAIIWIDVGGGGGSPGGGSGGGGSGGTRRLGNIYEY